MIPSPRKPLFEAEWREIRSFPGYSVSDTGFVRNDATGHHLTRLVNQTGAVYVGLVLDRKQLKRSVAPIVAEAFLTPHRYEAFDTPIHLDGDRLNNNVINLMWRPLWFARKYHQQFLNDRRGFRRPVQDIETGEIFETSWYAAIKYGLLDDDILMAWMNKQRVWPTGQSFVPLQSVDTHAQRNRGIL